MSGNSFDKNLFKTILSHNVTLFVKTDLLVRILLFIVVFKNPAIQILYPSELGVSILVHMHIFHVYKTLQQNVYARWTQTKGGSL